MKFHTMSKRLVFNEIAHIQTVRAHPDKQNSRKWPWIGRYHWDRRHEIQEASRSTLFQIYHSDLKLKQTCTCQKL